MLSFNEDKTSNSNKSNLPHTELDNIVNHKQHKPDDNEKIKFINNVFYISEYTISLLTLENHIKGDKSICITKYLLNDNNNLIDSDFTLDVEMMINLYNVIENSEILNDIKYEIIIKIIILLNAIITSDKINDDNEKNVYIKYYNNFLLILHKYVINKITSIKEIMTLTNTKISEIQKLKSDIIELLNKK